MRTALRALAIILVVVVVAAVALGLALRHPLPEGEPGPAAEALTDRVLASVNARAWSEVGAVQWSLGGRDLIVWDRRARRARIGEGDDVTWLDLRDFSGRAVRGGKVLRGAALARALERGRRDFFNDRFWLHPFGQLRAPGARRSRVVLDDGREGLRVDFTEGGVTPGDRYLWILGPDGRPVAWRMYVRIIPIPGLEVSWSGWTEIPGGALVSTDHELLGINNQVTRLKAGPDLQSIGRADAFAP